MNNRRFSFDQRRRRYTPLWAMLTLVALAFAAKAAVDVASQPVDPTGELVRTYAGLASRLPATGRIGFVGSGDDPTESARQLFAAQYALAPRVLVEDIDAVTTVITRFGGPSTLSHFELVAAGPHGVNVFQRIPTP